VTITFGINSKSCRHLQQILKVSAICSDTSSRSESTGRRSGLWWSCSRALWRSGNA